MLALPFEIARRRAFKRLQRLNLSFSLSLKGNILIFVGVRFHKWNREQRYAFHSEPSTATSFQARRGRERNLLLLCLTCASPPKEILRFLESDAPLRAGLGGLHRSPELGP